MRPIYQITLIAVVLNAWVFPFIASADDLPKLSLTSNCPYSINNTSRTLESLMSADCSAVYVIPSRLVTAKLTQVAPSVGQEKCGAINERVQKLSAEIFDLEIKLAPFDEQSRRDRAIIADFQNRIRIRKDELARLQSLTNEAYVDFEIEYSAATEASLQNVADQMKFENIRIWEIKPVEFYLAPLSVQMVSVALTDTASLIEQTLVDKDGHGEAVDYRVDGEERSLAFRPPQPLEKVRLKMRLGAQHACMTSVAAPDFLELLNQLVQSNLSVGVLVQEDPKDSIEPQESPQTRTNFYTDSIQINRYQSK